MFTLILRDPGRGQPETADWIAAALAGKNPKVRVEVVKENKAGTA